jgi:DNA-binding response OmpR family regulator
VVIAAVDTASIAELIDALAADGLSAEVATTVAGCVEHWRATAAGVVVVDADLTDGGALDACLQLRAMSQHVYIVVTGPDDEDLTVDVLDSGADDYAPRPHTPREIVARVHVGFRRMRQPITDRALAFGGRR